MPARLVFRRLYLCGNTISALPVGVFDQLTSVPYDSNIDDIQNLLLE